MKWSPSFECHVRPDGEHVYRIGHQLIDEFLEFVVGRARPNTVRAYAHDLSVFFSVVKKDPTRGAAQRRDGLRHRAAPSQARGRERGAHRRRLGGSFGGDDQAPAGGGLELLWLPDHPRRRRRKHQSCASRHRDTSEPLSGRAGPATGARGAPAAPDPRPRRDRLAHGGAAHRARPRHDPGHGARRSAALRGPRPSPGRSAPRRVAGAHQRGQGRTRASRAAVSHLLRHRRPLHGPRATRDDERCALRRAQRATARPTALDAGSPADHPVRPPAR